MEKLNLTTMYTKKLCLLALLFVSACATPKYFRKLDKEEKKAVKTLQPSEEGLPEQVYTYSIFPE